MVKWLHLKELILTKIDNNSLLSGHIFLLIYVGVLCFLYGFLFSPQTERTVVIIVF